jgi:hypothetical protein
MDIYEFNDFDDIMDDINKVYDDVECEYQTYIKSLQIVPYKPVDFTLLTYLNCISTYLSRLIIYLK